MSKTERPAATSARQRAKARIITPISRELTAAGTLSVLSGLLWPVQAAVVAWAVSFWALDPHSLNKTLIACVAFVLLGVVRAALEHRAGGMLFAAADQTIARERRAMINREARARTAMGSAVLASLAEHKLQALHPWITRYQVSLLRVAILPALLCALAFSVSWIVGIVLLVSGPLIPVFMALVGMAAEETSRRHMSEISSMNDMLMERLTALTDIRLLGATQKVVQDFSQKADTLRERTMAVLKVAFLSSTILELFSAIGVALVAVFVGFSLLGEIEFGYWRAPLTLGEGVFLLLIAPEFFQPMRDLSAAWHDRAAGLAVVDELEALDRADRAVLMGAGALVSPLSGPLEVVCRNAIAALPGRTVPLPDLTLSAGDAIAITGPSGIGKSTTLAAISGLVPLDAGQITVCGQLLSSDNADAWRSRIAMVPQRVHFPDTTLRQWLAPDGKDDRLAHALTLAKANEIIAGLANGLDTRLGETGGGVSGGEARRLMLARAIATGRELILADEPTADLDDETARGIITTLQQLSLSGHTVLVATHDPNLAEAMHTTIEMSS